MQDHWFKLSKRSLIILSIYFPITLSIGICMSIEALLAKSIFFDLSSIIEKSIYGSIGSALIGSGIFYSRKLYKACINLKFTPPVNENDKIMQLGVFLYFLLRPLFSIAFAIFIIISLKAGILVTTANSELNFGFLYLSMFFSFFTGFLAGNFLNIIEDAGGKFLSKLFNKEA